MFVTNPAQVTTQYRANPLPRHMKKRRPVRPTFLLLLRLLLRIFDWLTESGLHLPDNKNTSQAINHSIPVKSVAGMKLSLLPLFYVIVRIA